MRLPRSIKVLTAVTMLAIPLSTLGMFSSGKALGATGKYDDYFASRIEAVPLQPGSSSTDYAIVFSPSKNEYSYEVQYAGKNIFGAYACWHGNSAIRQSIEELKSLKIVTDVGGQLEVKKGENGVDASGSLHGGVNQEKNIDVNRAFGRTYNRNPAIVYREFHWRVVVYNQNHTQLYKTGWNGGQGDDIRTWNWTGDCAWVKQ